MNDTVVMQHATDAVAALLRNDGELLERGLNERTITFRLALYLQRSFSEAGLHVDCEYNRNGATPKDYLAHVGVNLDERVPLDDDEGRTAYPDILVHRRGTNDGNVLVVEAKKITKRDDRLDHAKLRAFLDPAQPYKYQLALFLVLSAPRSGPGATLVFKKYDRGANMIVVGEVRPLGNAPHVDDLDG